MNIEEFENKYKYWLEPIELIAAPSRDIGMALESQNASGFKEAIAELQKEVNKLAGESNESQWLNDDKLEEFGSMEKIIAMLKNKANNYNQIAEKSIFKSVINDKPKADPNVGVKLNDINDEKNKHIIAQARDYVNDFKSTLDDAVDCTDHRFCVPTIKQPIIKNNQRIGVKKIVDRKTDLEKRTEELSKLFDNQTSTINVGIPSLSEALKIIQEYSDKL